MDYRERHSEAHCAEESLSFGGFRDTSLRSV